MDAGELGLAAGEVVDGLRSVGTSQCGPPVLPECSERSFDDRRGNWLLWVLRRQQEVGRGVHCPLVQLEDAGGLLVAQWRSLDAWKGWWRAGEEDCRSDGFLDRMGCRCLKWMAPTVVVMMAEAQVV